MSLLGEGPRVVAFIFLSLISIALAQWSSWNTSDLSIIVPVREPWRLFICMVASIAIYFFRSYISRMEGKVTEAHTAKEHTRQFAALMVNAQHQANTPLQIISNTIAILKVRNPNEREHLERISRSVEVLRVITRVLAKYEHEVQWKDTSDLGDIESLKQDLGRLMDRTS